MENPEIKLDVPDFVLKDLARAVYESMMEEKKKADKSIT